MDIYEIIKTRKSVRSYKNKTVEDSKLKKIFEAVRLAPSARNAQEWHFVIVKNPDMRKKLAEAAFNQSFIAEAPVVVVCCAEPTNRIMRCGLEPFPIDTAIAIDHLTLLATAEGLGTCWIGSFNPEAVRKLLHIPNEIHVVELLPLGYPADPNPVLKKRKPLEEIVHNEEW
ncbi:MAG: nitroreductase family protein [Spirochaetota bacterium]